MKHITFYLDFVSPYAWLAYERLPDALLKDLIAETETLQIRILTQGQNQGGGVAPTGSLRR